MVNFSTPRSIGAQWRARLLSLRTMALPLLLIMALASCAAPATARQTSGGQTRVTPTPTSTQTISDTNPAPSLTLAQAWGAVAITRVPSLLPNGELFIGGDNATPDGQWLIGEVEPRGMLDNKTVYPQLALYNIHTLQVRVIQTLRNPQSRLDDISTDGRWLAWTDAVNSVNWVMYVCDLQTGAIRTLATALSVNGQYAPSHSGPLVSNGYAIWSQSTEVYPQGNLNGLPSVHVQEENLSSGAVTTVGHSAYVDSFSWPWVASDQYTSTGSSSVVLQNLLTQQRKPLNVESGANSLGLDGATAALEDNAGATLALIPDVARSTTLQTVYAINPAYNVQMGYLTMNDRLVAWRGDGSFPMPTVWDRAQHVTVTLPTANTSPVSEAYAAGALLTWLEPTLPAAQEQAGEQQGLSPLETYCIVNTTQLPIKAPSV